MNTKQAFSLNLLNNLKKDLAHRKKELIFSPWVISLLIGVSVLPLVMLIHSMYTRYEQVSQAEKRIETLEIKAKKTALTRARASSFIKQLQQADPHFLKNTLESMTLLAKEKKNLEFFLNIPMMKESSTLLEREKKLRNNRLSLQEVAHASVENIRENIYVLKKPIEVGADDLQHLLNTMENGSTSFVKEKPQYIFQSFSLKKKILSKNYEVFECDFKVIERLLEDKT
jgi:hypothetical protein